MTTINERIAQLLEALHVSKTEFAEQLKITPQYASKMVRSGTPSDRVLTDICERYNVRREWLFEGEGEMFEEVTEEEIIAEFVARVIAKQSDDFKKRTLKMLASLDEDGWRALEIITRKIKEEG